MGIQITVDQGKGTPRQYLLKSDQVATLGRHANNTVVLDDEHASRWHALVHSENGRWFISPVGNPVNGTRVNGEAVLGQVELLDGHEILIGDTRLVIGLEQQASATPSDPNSTLLCPDELATMYSFLSRAVNTTDHQGLIRLALETVARQTQASVAGYLSLDEEPQARVIYPEQEQLDVPLSRKLTQQVLQSGRSVWAARSVPAALPESLRGYRDALCIPVPATGPTGTDNAFVGAMHLYKAGGTFTERNQRYGEVVAGSLAGYLAALRTLRSLQADNARLFAQARATESILGNSGPMVKLRDEIARAARHRSTVLIRGETGVGKELVALALHRQSPRRDGPLVVVNCATLAGQLLESQMFGHRKGAFTGADRDRVGLFEEADEGTLFLDEVGELPLEGQAKLLRVIEGHGFRPVGGSVDVRVDVRILAATNRDLEQEAAGGKFRRDLLYRLQVIQFHVPPLRQHPEDIPNLIEFYLKKWVKPDRSPVRVTDAALQALESYAWPGNVRQLLAVLESAVAMSEGDTLGPHDLPIPTEGAQAAGMPLNLEELEAWALREALKQTNGNVTRAAKLLGINRDTFAAKMKQNDISRHKL